MGPISRSTALTMCRCQVAQVSGAGIARAPAGRFFRVSQEILGMLGAHVHRFADLPAGDHLSRELHGRRANVVEPPCWAHRRRPRQPP